MCLPPCHLDTQLIKIRPDKLEKTYKGAGSETAFAASCCTSERLCPWSRSHLYTHWLSITPERASR